MPTEKLGRYEIISELGKGAMGVVYKAIDPLIERTVAIKTIKLDLSKQELDNFEERFYREAKSAGRLNHQNIVTIYDIGKSDNIAYMAMELMEGQLLRDILDSHTALSISKIVDIVAQIADGLAYAHENGIVHRDIKPANIMLVRDGVAKIMDFGIAQMPSGSCTLAGTVMGSPKYMAPEQIAGKSVDGRSDLFALGVILYELLTGEPPFDGDNINSIMYRILNEPPVPPKTLTPRIPESFNFIIAKALAKNPDERYQNAKDLANDLRKHGNPVPTVITAVENNKPRRLNSHVKSASVDGDKTVLLNAGTRHNNIQNSSYVEQTEPQFATLLSSAFWRDKKIIWVASGVILLTVIFMLIGEMTRHKLQSISTQTEIPSQPIIIKPSSQGMIASTKSTQPNPTTVQSNSFVHQKSALASTETSPIIKDNAILNFTVRPWGTIYIDGKKMGVTPPVKKLTVSAGKHKIEIRNLNFKPYSQTVDLKAESTKNIKYTFK